MKIIYEGLEPYGFSQLLVPDDFEVKPPYTETPPPVPNYKPKWTGVEWVELATEEEKSPPIPEPEPSELDLTKEELKKTKEDITNTQLALAEMFENQLGG